MSSQCTEVSTSIGNGVPVFVAKSIPGGSVKHNTSEGLLAQATGAEDHPELHNRTLFPFISPFFVSDDLLSLHQGTRVKTFQLLHDSSANPEGIPRDGDWTRCTLRVFSDPEKPGSNTDGKGQDLFTAGNKYWVTDVETRYRKSETSLLPPTFVINLECCEDPIQGTHPASSAKSPTNALPGRITMQPVSGVTAYAPQGRPNVTGLYHRPGETNDKAASGGTPGSVVWLEKVEHPWRYVEATVDAKDASTYPSWLSDCSDVASGKITAFGVGLKPDPKALKVKVSSFLRFGNEKDSKLGVHSMLLRPHPESRETSGESKALDLVGGPDIPNLAVAIFSSPEQTDPIESAVDIKDTRLSLKWFPSSSQPSDAGDRALEITNAYNSDWRARTDIQGNWFSVKAPKQGEMTLTPDKDSWFHHTKGFSATPKGDGKWVVSGYTNAPPPNA